jgi:hypothetical protein
MVTTIAALQLYLASYRQLWWLRRHLLTGQHMTKKYRTRFMWRAQAGHNANTTHVPAVPADSK